MGEEFFCIHEKWSGNIHGTLKKPSGPQAPALSKSFFHGAKKIFAGRPVSSKRRGDFRGGSFFPGKGEKEEMETSEGNVRLPEKRPKDRKRKGNIDRKILSL
jgi:hypothetical protein